ncbi:hypothetical protein D030_0254B, partial [Vibrio parahaemolyticus AQ3810]
LVSSLLAFGLMNIHAINTVNVIATIHESNSDDATM